MVSLASEVHSGKMPVDCQSTGPGSFVYFVVESAAVKTLLVAVGSTAEMESFSLVVVSSDGKHQLVTDGMPSRSGLN